MVGGTVTGMIVIGCYVRITAVNLDDNVRGGMTALPNANADAAGGLPLSDAGGLDIDTLLGRLDAAITSRSSHNAAAAADAVWDEALNDHKTKNTFGGLQAMVSKWEITSNQLKLYSYDGTLLYTFNLTRDAEATEFNPDLRTPV